jgi:6-phosphogluconolactonase (cycloisomerase 2 family)
LAVDATSSFLFTANEGTSDLTGFLISSTGRLTMISGYPVTVGTAPVFVVIDDAHSYLYVGNQSTSNVSVFSFDAKDGTVFETGDSPFTVLNAPGFMILP